MTQTLKTLMVSHKKKVAALVCVLIILTLLPVGVKYGAIYYLESRLALAENVVIKDIDLNLFTGHFGIEGMTIRSGNTETLRLNSFTANLSMLSLLRKRILVESLDIDGLNLPVVNSKEILTAGVPIPKTSGSENEITDTDENKTPLHFGIRELFIKNSFVSYADEKVSLTIPITLIQLEKLFTWEPDTEAVLTTDIKIDKTPVTSEIKLKPFADNREFHTSIRIDSFDLTSVSGYAAPFVNELHGLVSADTILNAVIQKDNTVKIEQSGSVSVSGISGIPMESPVQVKLNDASIAWQGDAGIELKPGKGLPELTINGTASNKVLDVTLGDNRAVVRHEGLMWKGDISLPEDGIQSITASGSIGLDNLRLNGETSNVNILALRSLRLDDIAVSGLNRISAGLFSTSGLSLAKPVTDDSGAPAESLYGNESVYISDIQLSDMSSIRIKSVELSDNRFYIHQTEPSQLPLINALKRFFVSVKNIRKKREEKQNDRLAEGVAPGSDEAEIISDSEEINAADSAEERTKRVIVGIESISLSGSNVIKIIDKSVVPHFSKSITIDTFTVTGISNATPEDEAAVEIKLSTERHTSLALTGTVLPFHSKVNGDFRLVVDNLNLVGFSPYVSSKTGYNIKTGILDSEINCKIVSDELIVDNRFVINNIKLSPDEDEMVDQFVKQFSLPLDYTLSVLRDSDNNVTLSIPVTGNIRNPNFNYNDVFKKATVKALQAASISVVKNLLQPYGSVITIAQYAYEGGKFVSRIRLEPMMFQPGVSELDEKSQEYLNSVVKLLKEKEDLRLSVCGFSTQEDFPEIVIEDNPNPFVELAQQRMEAVAIFLENQGIHHERIFTCNADSQAGEGFKPRVEFSI